MPAIDLADWARTHVCDPVEVDCVTAVMLKILDGKCRMGEAEKHTLRRLYDLVHTRPGCLLGAEDHELIAAARRGSDEAMVARIYERRVLAESAISRPVMKAFKAMLRAEGVTGGESPEEGGE